MKKPEITPLNKEEWICVAPGAKDVWLHQITCVPQVPVYYWTYRVAGDTEVPTEVKEGVVWNTPSTHLQFPEKVDLYLWAQHCSGKIRVDILV